MAGFDRKLYSLKADSSACADDQNCTHRIMLQLEVPELPELPQYTIIVLLAFPAPCSSGISVPPPRSSVVGRRCGKLSPESVRNEPNFELGFHFWVNALN